MFPRTVAILVSTSGKVELLVGTGKEVTWPLNRGGVGIFFFNSKIPFLEQRRAALGSFDICLPQNRGEILHEGHLWRLKDDQHLVPQFVDQKGANVQDIRDKLDRPRRRIEHDGHLKFEDVCDPTDVYNDTFTSPAGRA